MELAGSVYEYLRGRIKSSSKVRLAHHLGIVRGGEARPMPFKSGSYYISVDGDR